jgi:hypothetical protein
MKINGVCLAELMNYGKTTVASSPICILIMKTSITAHYGRQALSLQQ